MIWSIVTMQPIGGADIEEMLRAVRAPEPWRNPLECWTLAEQMTAMRRTLQSVENANQPRPLAERAQEAVNELRRVLPEIIAWLSYPIEIGGLDISEPHRLGRLEKLRQLEAALFDIEPKLPNGRRPPPPWGDRDTHAAYIWYGYVRIVGRGTFTKNGPAVRFVSRALEAIGYHRGKATEAGIGEALRRMDADGKLARFTTTESP